MEKIRMKLQQFMMGRNGADNLSRTIMFASIAVYLISMFVSGKLGSIMYMIAMAGMMYCIYRMFSKNVYKRSDENQKYLNTVQKFKYKVSQRKEYRFFKCSGCGKMVRVPRGKGKIEITCPECKTKMIHKT
ncbi:MAG: hypothetical protein ACK5LL_11185 [Suipraeoptans sp.]